MATQPIDFLAAWRTVPTVWVDFETTGVIPGVDAAVEVALVRFDAGTPVERFSTRVNPGRPIPAEATKVHGISDADVANAPSIVGVFDQAEVCKLIKGAQPGAYNSPFDRMFVPPGVLDHHWPWLDAMVAVKMADPYAKGRGRYKLSAACERHGIELTDAHSAKVDAEAAGKLFYKIAPKLFETTTAMGNVLARLDTERVKDWHRFHSWLAKQPKRSDSAASKAGE